MYKKLFTALLFSFIAGVSSAQSTLTGANLNPVAGDGFIVVNSDTTNVQEGSSGPAVIWDYSSLDTVSIDTGIATPCAYVYPPCSWANGSTLAIATESQNIKIYDSVGSNRLTQYGIYYATNQYVVFTTPIDVIRYPFTYLSTFNDTFTAIVTYMGVTFPPATGAETVTCDAYGTLILPGHQVDSNVLRIHTTGFLIDSFNLFGFNAIDTFYIDNYNWYIPDYHTPLLNIGFSVSGLATGSTPDKTVSFAARKFASLVPSVPGIQASLQLYPNPVNDELNIKYTVPYGEQVSITLLDMLGRERGVISNQYAQGTESISYNTTSLPPGLYLVRLQSGTETVTQKIEIR